MKNFILNWIWQLPQNLLGLAYKTLISSGLICRVNDADTTTEIWLKPSNGGVTLGKYVFICQDYKDLEATIKHEKGHVKQSKILGPLYLLVIGIPSIIHAAWWYFNSETDYYRFYTERWANKLMGIK